MHLFLSLLAAGIIGMATAQMATFATTVHLHRSLSHRSLTLRPAAAWCFRFGLWVSVGIKPREWVAVHRKHHAFTDAEGDPHSPRLLGWVRVQLTNAALYRKVARDPEQVAQYAKDIPRDRWDRVLFDHGYLGLTIGTVALVLVFGPLIGLVAAGVHTVSYLGLNAAVNAVTHTFGRRPNDNTATNLRWLALLTAGEGLHNNHHHAPYSARLSFRRWEFDPSWPAIRLMERLRLARVRHRSPRAAGAVEA